MWNFLIKLCAYVCMAIVCFIISMWAGTGCSLLGLYAGLQARKIVNSGVRFPSSQHLAGDLAFCHDKKDFPWCLSWFDLEAPGIGQ